MKPYLKVVIAISLVFMLGLALFFLFAAEFGDGLENTMESAGAEEGEPVFNAPLDYGDSYPVSLAMGFVGALATLILVWSVGRGLGKEDA